MLEEDESFTSTELAHSEKKSQEMKESKDKELLPARPGFLSLDAEPSLAPMYWILSREVRERFKVFDGICSFMEDFSDAQNVLGKGLIKIEGFSLSFNHKSKDTAMLMQLSNLFECIHKSYLSLGVEHLNFSSAVSLQFSKQFKDLSKDGNRKVAMISQHLQSSVEDVNKEKTEFAKKMKKYERLADKLESLILELSSKEEGSNGSGGNTDEGFMTKVLFLLQRTIRSYILLHLYASSIYCCTPFSRQHSSWTLFNGYNRC